MRVVRGHVCLGFNFHFSFKRPNTITNHSLLVLMRYPCVRFAGTRRPGVTLKNPANHAKGLGPK